MKLTLRFVSIVLTIAFLCQEVVFACPTHLALRTLARLEKETDLEELKLLEYAETIRRMQDEIEEVGGEIYDFSKLRTLEKFNTTNFMLKVAMRDEYTRVQVVRFVEAFSAIKNDKKEIISHLRQFFPYEDKRIAGWLRFVVKQVCDRLEGDPDVEALKAWAISFFLGRTAKNFFGGETAGEVVRTVRRRRHKENFGHTIDVLGEAVVSLEEARTVKRKYLDLLREDGVEEVSVKLTSLCPAAAFDPINPQGSIEALREPLKEILIEAKRRGVAVTIDMESYACKEITLKLFEEMVRDKELRDYNKLGVVLQAYLKDTDEDLKNMVALARDLRAERGGNKPLFNIRLVRGAYWDYETMVAEANGWNRPVFENKRDTDNCYERSTLALLDNHDLIRPAIATHNSRSVALAMAYAEINNIPKNRFVFQMLYGMGDDRKRAIIRRGYAMEEYVPQGDTDADMPYYMRRLLENTSNMSALIEGRLGRDAFMEGLKNPNDRQYPEDLRFDEEEMAPFVFKRGAEVNVAPLVANPTLDQHAAKAAEVFGQYRYTSLEQRIGFAREAAKRLRKMGRPGQARAVLASIEEVQRLIDEGKTIVQSVPGETNEYRYIPIGTGMVLLRDPVASDTRLIRALITPLLTGNTALVHASGPWSSFASDLIPILEQAGFPRYALQVVDNRTAPDEMDLVSHPHVDWVYLDGDYGRGRDLQVQAVESSMIDGVGGNNRYMIRKFIAEFYPGEYARELVWAKSIAVNTATRGYSTRTRSTGGLEGFSNTPLRDFRSQRVRKDMQRAIDELVPVEEMVPLIINGEEVRTESTFVSENPSTGETVVRCSRATKENIYEGIARARGRLDSWKNTSVHTRAQVLFEIARIIEERRDSLSAEIVREVDKTWREADGDAAEAIDFCNNYGRQIIEMEKAGEMGEPKGVCAIIPPWNFASAIPMGLLVAVIATGNTGVFKPSEDAPYIGYLLMGILKEARLPDGVINLVTLAREDVDKKMGGELGDYLVDNVDMSPFTGSKAVGFEIIRRGVRNTGDSRVVMETGGKNAMICSKTADIVN